jgi:hypothetical protein
MAIIVRASLLLGWAAVVMGCTGQVTVAEPAPPPVGVEQIGQPPPPDDGHDIARGPDRMPPPPKKEPASTAMALDPNTCLSLVETGWGRRIVKIDLASGGVTNGPDVRLNGNPLLSEMWSIGVKGNDMWLCNTPPGNPGQTVTKVSLATGVATPFSAPCSAVTATESGIFALSADGTEIARYADETAVVAGTPSETTGGYDVRILGPATNGVLASLHKDNGVVTATGRVPLDGYSGWLFGLSEATGGRIIVSSPAIWGGTGTLESFDATGQPLGTVATFANPPGSSGMAGFWGLACAH